VRHYEADLPSIAELRVYKAPQVTRILARDGTVLAELYTERRTTVPLATLPAHVKLAVLAAEDAGFYEHEGLNYWGIARAALVNLRAGGTRQGGSTITQQVIKNMTLNARERTLTRKIREALLARRLETELSKDEILEIYLNAIYFGRGRYGIEEAARDDRASGDDSRSDREPARIPSAHEHDGRALAARVRTRSDAREGISR
jgi:penicillin-binding protein 1A